MINYNIIGSSSKGNAIIIENKLLLDCGVSYKRLKKYLKDIKLIFISHVHKDHLLPTSIKQIAYNYPNIKYVTGSDDVIYKLSKCGVKPFQMFRLKSNVWYDLGIIKVRLEEVTHDVPNHCLKWKYNNEKGIYIVDTANVDNIKAKNYDLYLIESNYNEEILNEHIRNCEDKNQLIYLQRVPYTHLSFNKANSFLVENMGDNSNFEYIHKSNYNFEEGIENENI